MRGFSQSVIACLLHGFRGDFRLGGLRRIFRAVRFFALRGGLCSELCLLFRGLLRFLGSLRIGRVDIAVDEICHNGLADVAVFNDGLFRETAIAVIFVFDVADQRAARVVLILLVQEIPLIGVHKVVSRAVGLDVSVRAAVTVVLLDPERVFTTLGKSGAELEKAVNDAARFTGLKDELLEKSPFDLSGGEKRRAAIAGVIAMNPEVLVLDEPTAGLDPMGRDVLLSQIVQYHKERKNTVILVSHSMEDIARVADKIIVMNKSNLVMFDKTKEVFSKGRELEEIGLRVPQITKIMLELREKGFNVPEGILTVDEAMDCISSLLDKEGKIW